ncbi:MAG TPA: ABC transporter permease [Trebonia sp.]
MTEPTTRADAETAAERPPEGDGSTTAGWRRQLNRQGVIQNLVLLAVIGVLAAIFDSFNSGFLSPANISAIGQSAAVVGVLSVIETVVIICGVLDISVGAQAGVGSVISAMVFSGTGSPAVSVLAAIGLGIVLGAVNGVVIVYGRVNSIIATLGTFSAYKGLALVITGGQSKGFVLANPFYIFLARGALLGIPASIWIFAAISAGIYVLLRYTDIGRNIFAIGGNDTAARLAGIDINKYLIAIYALTGVVCAVAGIMITASAGSAEPTTGQTGLELQAITAAALGGALLTGGRGGIGGTVLAVLLISTLINGLTFLQVNSFWENIAQGAMLVAAVVIQKARSGERRVGRPT